MYHILNLRACKHRLDITTDLPAALVDSEDVLVAAVSKSGHLIYHNRSFMKAYRSRMAAAGGMNLRDAFPELWRRLPNLRKEHRDDLVKVIDLHSGVSTNPVGYLLVSFKDGGGENRPIDFRAMLQEAEHPLFVNSYVGFYVADPEAYTLKVNPAYEKIAFLPESDLVGRNLRELEERGYFSRSVTLRVLEKLKEGRAEDVTLFQRIITGQEAVVTGRPIFSDDGKLQYVLTLVQNILPLEKIVRKIEEAEDRRRLFPLVSKPGKSGGVGPPGHPGASNVIAPIFPDLPVVAMDPLSLGILRQAVHAAGYKSPVLLCGETGVGKDVMAQYIHRVGSRNGDSPFVAINTSAIPQELLESELFGYEEGAFSGAKKGGKRGLFEEAHSGTLFLNEISEMPLNLQAKLPSALDEGGVRRLGGSKTKKVEVRIICATNRDLGRCVADGSFRSDLYYRIKVLAIDIPPLRARPRDVLPLIHHFMMHLSREHSITRYLCADVQDILLAYTWPGNIRELRNVIERLVVFSTTEQISVGDLPSEVIENVAANRCGEESELDEAVSLKEAVKRFERSIIEQALKRYGRVSAAASALAIDPTTLIRKLKKSD
ncbi:MAG: sigma 54-interacting transcriptional regulator [Syntrophobacteraceae bacterium]|nr:sigma 54-interacting transcriptional regulator [Syntrophobacteraceae bacterium]